MKKILLNTIMFAAAFALSAQSKNIEFEGEFFVITTVDLVVGIFEVEDVVGGNHMEGAEHVVLEALPLEVVDECTAVVFAEDA